MLITDGEMQKLMKKNLLPAVMFFVLFCFISCATTSSGKKAVLTEGPERMFWRISASGPDGTPAAVYIQGTIHVGDDRLYPPADSVMTAWKLRQDRRGNLDGGMGFISGGTSETRRPELHRCFRPFCL